MPVVDPDGVTSSYHILGYAAALGALTVVPFVAGTLGIVYLAGAVVLGCGFIVVAFRFVLDRTGVTARHVFAASLIYLPLLMIIMVLDRILPTL
jgi:protoheme IX farnesyltransferase